MNPKVDAYLASGCGRCPFYDTPQCKVHLWIDVLEALRRIVLSCDLEEEVKWGVPCYTFQGDNVLLLGTFKESCVLSFLKGALLSDPEGILMKPGENTQAGRVVRFTHLQEVLKIESTLKTYIYEAIEVERAGLKVQLKASSEYAIPEELQLKLNEFPAFQEAFFALSPGRQRGYLLHFSQPKQSQTREARILKCIPQILAGKGMQD
jgi:uncharacterized protein YdeI (YjbR/CyaY-like superfamily)